MKIRSHHSYFIAFVLATAGHLPCAAVASDRPERPDAPTLQEVLNTAKPGTRIKVMQTDGTMVEGGLVKADRLTLFNSVEERQYAFEWVDVDTLWELRVSKARGQRVGGTIGLILGAVTGAEAGLGLSGLCMDGECDDSPNASLIISGAFLGGLVGGCAGLLIGNAVSEGTPEWIRRYPVNGEGHE